MTNIDTSYLAKLLGMLGSSHDGEALNAARIADRMVRKANLTWEQILFAGRSEDFINELAAQAYAAGKSDARHKTFASYSRAILDDPQLRVLLTDWEIDYLTSWTKKSFTPTPKQLDVFARIFHKTGVLLPETQEKEKDPFRDI